MAELAPRTFLHVFVYLAIIRSFRKNVFTFWICGSFYNFLRQLYLSNICNYVQYVRT
jgi:hypothetical protein